MPSAVTIGNTYEFAPSGQNSDDTLSLDAFILAYSPWGYWKCNEASGNPQDSSGNARHGTAFGAGIAYSQAPITPRAGNSVGLANHRFRFPSPWQRFGALANTWAIGGLFTLSAELGTASPPALVTGSAFFGQLGASSAASFSDAYVGIARTYGDIPVLKSGTNGGGSGNGMPLNKPMAIFLVGSSVPGVVFTIELYINGVKVGQCIRGNVGNGTVSTFSIGQAEDGAVPYPQMRASNICCWNAEISHRQIIDITEAMMDKDSYAAAYKP